MNGDASIFAWDLWSNQPIDELEKQGDIYSLKVMENDYEIYAGNNLNYVKYLNLQRKSESWDLHPPHLDTVNSMTSIGDVLVSGSRGTDMKFWDIGGHKDCTMTLSHAHAQSITCLASNKNYIFSGSKDATVKVWELPSTLDK